jgi:hypothetical protein
LETFPTLPVWKYRLEGATSFLGISPGNAEQRLVSSDRLQLPRTTNKAEAPSVAHLMVFKISRIATTECEFTLHWQEGSISILPFSTRKCEAVETCEKMRTIWFTEVFPTNLLESTNRDELIAAGG